MRLGWLSLDYLLAYHALRWFLKAYNGNKTEELCQQWVAIKGSEKWEHSSFYRPAFNFLNYLNGLVEVDLFTCSKKSGFEPIRDALFIDLTRYWKGMRGAHDTHLIYTEWKERTIGMQMLNRSSVCLYHEVACGSSMLGDSLRRKGISEGLCRNGCGKRETMDHVIIDCTGYADRRIKMTNARNKLGVDMITSIIMTDKRLQPLVEDWLMAIGLTKLKNRKK